AASGLDLIDRQHAADQRRASDRTVSLEDPTGRNKCPYLDRRPRQAQFAAAEGYAGLLQQDLVHRKREKGLLRNTARLLGARPLKSRLAELDAVHIGFSEIGRREIGVPKVGACKPRMAQIRPPHDRT